MKQTYIQYSVLRNAFNRTVEFYNRAVFREGPGLLFPDIY